MTYFGGKSRVAREVWRRFGDVPNYIEPFFGSGAVLLGRPEFDGNRIETVNDADGHLSNFWRPCKPTPTAWPDMRIGRFRSLTFMHEATGFSTGPTYSSG